MASKVVTGVVKTTAGGVVPVSQVSFNSEASRRIRKHTCDAMR